MPWLGLRSSSPHTQAKIYRISSSWTITGKWVLGSGLQMDRRSRRRSVTVRNLGRLGVVPAKEAMSWPRMASCLRACGRDYWAMTHERTTSMRTYTVSIAIATAVSGSLP